MKKYKDLIIVVVVLVAVIGGTYLLSKSAENKNFKEISYEEYQNLSNKDENVLVYVTSKANESALSTVKEYAKSNNLTFKYIYVDDLTDEQKEALNYSNDMIIYNSKDDDKIYDGEITSTNLTNFLVEVGVLPKTYITITIDEYLELIKQENVVVFIAREGCGYCDKFKPIVNQVMVDNKITIYQLDVTNFTEADYESLYTTASYFTEEQWGTPTTLIFNKGQVVNVLGGYVEQDALESFLKTNGVL